MTSLIQRISNCDLCKSALPQAPKPILQFSETAQIIVIGQAPGKAAHDSEKPWNDKSGDRLREWLSISSEVFYDAQKVALVPMGFCFPGQGKSGDLPPRRECAPKWHGDIFQQMSGEAPKLLVGSYAQSWYLKDSLSLTERCKNWFNYAPEFLVLPHPSPRNNIWLKKNPWFESEVIPAYRKLIQAHLNS